MADKKTQIKGNKQSQQGERGCQGRAASNNRVASFVTISDYQWGWLSMLKGIILPASFQRVAPSRGLAMNRAIDSSWYQRFPVLLTPDLPSHKREKGLDPFPCWWRGSLVHEGKPLQGIQVGQPWYMMEFQHLGNISDVCPYLVGQRALRKDARCHLEVASAEGAEVKILASPVHENISG